MKPKSEAGAKLITLQLAPAQVLELYSFLALGAAFRCNLFRRVKSVLAQQSQSLYCDHRGKSLNYSHGQTGESRRGGARARTAVRKEEKPNRSRAHAGHRRFGFSPGLPFVRPDCLARLGGLLHLGSDLDGVGGARSAIGHVSATKSVRGNRQHY